MKKYYFFILVILVAHSSMAQLISGNSFLQGKFIEVGIAPNGTIGSHVPPPVGYHPNVSTSFGVVADVEKDGWLVAILGHPRYYGDFITPGSPVEFWTIMANGRTGKTHNVTADSLFTGGLIGEIVSGSYFYKNLSTVWQGVFDSLLITQTYTVNHLGLNVAFNVKIQNISSKAINDVFYCRNVDPDNDAIWSFGGFKTQNVIEQQNPSTSNRCLVSAKGDYEKSYFGIAAKDPRAKVYFLKRGLLPEFTIDSLFKKIGVDTNILSGKVGDSLHEDVGMGIVFNLGNFYAGDSVEFDFEYVFSDNNCDHYLWNHGELYNSKDTIFGCYGDFFYAEELMSTNKGKWKWNASPFIDTTYSPAITFEFNDVQSFRAISVDSSKCNSGFDTFNIALKSYEYKKPKLYSSGAVLWVDSIYMDYLWNRDTLAIPFTRFPSYLATLPGDYFVKVLYKPGCKMNSDTIYIDPITANIPTSNLNVQLSIGPNPFTEKIQVNYLKPLKITIFDQLGRVVIKETTSKIIDLSAFSDGVYIIQIVCEEDSCIEKRKIIKRSY